MRECQFVKRSAVRDDCTVIAPVITQNARQQIGICTVGHPVQSVVGAHHAQSASILRARLERWIVRCLQVPVQPRAKARLTNKKFV